MKYTIVFAAILVVGLLALIAAAPIVAEDASQSEATETVTSTFHVTGMTCGGCEAGVRRVVKKLEGVKKVEASYEAGTATVTYRSDTVSPEAIIAAIEKLGYSAELLDDEEDA